MALFRSFSKFSALSRSVYNKTLVEITPATTTNTAIRSICTSKPMNDLMEFFDDKANWGQQEVKSGRGWRKEDLRIKSNSDLHKLWYVLLKERNMLLTMEEQCNKETKVFPSPERLDKVEESMENLEAVVRERNKAYYQLETGEIGEKPATYVQEPFGIEYQPTEWEIPQHLNTKWQEEHKVHLTDKQIRDFTNLKKEQDLRERRKQQTRNFNHVIHLMNRFPNLDMEAVKEQYPDVDIEKAKNSRKYKPRYQKED